MLNKKCVVLSASPCILYYFFAVGFVDRAAFSNSQHVQHTWDFYWTEYTFFREVYDSRRIVFGLYPVRTSALLPPVPTYAHLEQDKILAQPRGTNNRIWLFFYVHGTVHRFNVFKHNQQDAMLNNDIYYYKCSTCFRRFLRPSSGAQNCTHSTVYMSSFYCFIPLSRVSWNSRS